MTIISDELDDETKDLFVTIDNPEKHATTMESYITFRVVTKVKYTWFLKINFIFVQSPKCATFS